MSEAQARGADVRTKQLDGLYLRRRNKSAADQQAIAKHQGGLPVHNYTNRSIAITRGPGTEHCPSIAAHLNQPKHQ